MADPNDKSKQKTKPFHKTPPPDQGETVDSTQFFDTDSSLSQEGSSADGVPDHTLSLEEFTAGLPTPEDRVGALIGKYEVKEILGRGGMGVVYRAHDPAIDRDVAIKLLSEDLSSSEAVKRFLAEARAAGRLSHPNTVSIFEVGRMEQNLFIVMEFVSAGSVEDALAQHGAFSVAKASRIAADACKGLAAAHAVGLVHRDIKPANLLIAAGGIIKVADFGLVKVKSTSVGSITTPGQVMGTPHFMSPEQCEAKPVDLRSDIYSLGATYYSLLTGLKPYLDTDSVMQVMFAHCKADIPDPTETDDAIPRRCSAIVTRAMAKSPQDRYQSADEMLADLEALASGGSGSFGAVSDGPTSFLEPVDEDPVDEDREATNRSNRSTKVPGVTAVDFRPSGESSQGGWFHHRCRIFAGVGLIVLLALGLLVLQQFRSGGPADPSYPTGQSAVSAGAGAVGDASAATGVAGVTPTTVTFGTTTAYSGTNRDMGRNMAVGIRTCFAAVNEAGGINGRKLKLVVLDDGYEPQRAIANMRDLFENRDVFAVIGNVGTPTAAVTVPYAIENKHLFFAPFSGANILRQDPPDRYVFNYRASYSDETAAMVRYFIDVKGIAAEQIAVFAQKDAYGDDGFRGVARALRKHGVREDNILRVGYDRNSIDVKEAVERIAARIASVKAVVIVATSSAAANFINQLGRRGLKPTLGVVSGASTTIDEELKAIAPQHTKGVIVTQIVPHYNSGATGVIRYRKLLKKHFPEYQPGFMSLEGFIAAECLVAGLKKTGQNLTTETLIDSLESIRDLDLGVGPIMSFGPSKHQASNKVWGTVLDESGNFHNLDMQ